jgi:hypothetical protein
LHSFTSSRSRAPCKRPERRYLWPTSFGSWRRSASGSRPGPSRHHCSARFSRRWLPRRSATLSRSCARIRSREGDQTPPAPSPPGGSPRPHAVAPA